MTNNILSNKNVKLLEGLGTPLNTGATGPTGSFYLDKINGKSYVCVTAGSSAGWETPAVGDFLPLTGGTMSGTIAIQSGDSIKVTGSTGTRALISSADGGGFGSYPWLIKTGQYLYATTYGTTLHFYDSDLNAVSAPDSSGQYWAMSYNNTLDRIYVGNFSGSALTVSYINGASAGATSVTSSGGTNSPSGNYQDVLTYNAFSDKVYSFDYNTSDVYVWGPDGGYISNTNVGSSSFAGYGIIANQTNGKVYVRGNVTGEAFPTYVRIYNSAMTQIGEIGITGTIGIYEGAKYSYNGDLNRVYFSGGDKIVVIDGDTDSQLPSIDLSSYGTVVDWIDYSSGKIFVSIDSTHQFLIIDANTNTVEVLKTGNSTADMSIISDGSYIYLADYNPSILEKWELTKSTKITSFNYPSPNLNTIVNWPAKGGTVALLDDIPTVLNTGKILWVDATYGNNTTAEAYNSQKPYQTISSAITAAVSGDLIYVLPGNYAIGTITLKDGVNIHTMNGVNITSGQIRDNSIAVNCTITGAANFTTTTNNGIFDIRGSGSKVYFEYNTITFSNIGNMGFVGTGTEVHFKCNTYYSQGPISHRGTGKAHYKIDNIIIQSSGSSDRRFLDTRDSFSGTINLEFDTLTFEDNGTGYQWLIHLDSLTSDARIVINGNRIVSTNTTLASSVINNYFLSANAVSEGNIIFNVKYIESEVRSLFVSSGVGSTASRYIFNNIQMFRNSTGSDPYYYPLILMGRQNQKCIFDNCRFEIGSTGADANNLIVIGNSTVSGTANIIEETSLNAEFDKCKFIKNSLGTRTEPLISVGSTNSNISFKNCDIVIDGATAYAFGADSLDKGNVYFKNTVSNMDNNTNITDTAVVSGFIGNDTNLTIL